MTLNALHTYADPFMISRKHENMSVLKCVRASYGGILSVDRAKRNNSCSDLKLCQQVTI